VTKRHPKRYHSEIRAEAAERTRERILQAVMDHLADDGGPITLRAIARRAGVSTPTVIRNFADRDRLIEAFWEWVQPRLGLPARPPPVHEALEHPARQIALFEAHHGFFRSLIVTRQGRAMRKMRFAQRTEVVQRSVEPALRALSPEARRRVIALLKLFIVPLPLWLEMRDMFGLPPEDIARALTWVGRLILDELARDPTSAEGG